MSLSRLKIFLVVFGLIVPVMARPVDPLGILSLEVLSDNNPMTFQKWKAGDTYRLIFITSAKRNAISTNIAVYNNWVQGLANASLYPIGADRGLVWKALGSTDTVDARDNTSSNFNVDGPGGPVYLLDGQTNVFQGNYHMWNGSPYQIINLTEQGEIFTGWPWTGTYSDGTRAVDHSWSFNSLGGTLPEGNEIHVNQGNSANRFRWMWYYWLGDPPESMHTMYALSDPITIIDDTPNSFTIEMRGSFLDFRWPSKSGSVYDLVSSTNLGMDPATWPVYFNYSNMTASGTGYNYLTISRNGDKRFFAIIER